MELILHPLTDTNDDVSRSNPVCISSNRLGVEWIVPTEFMELSVEQIIQIALRAGAPNPNAAEYVSHINNRLPGVSTAASLSTALDGVLDVLESDLPPTSLEGQTLHDYRALMALGSVCTVIKYWVYLKLLWRHRGIEDDIVIAVMARCENMHEPSPLTHRKNSRQWTLVRNGLRVMEILLNNRGLLIQLLVTRRLSFNNLICLKQEWLQQSVLQQLVAVVQHNDQLALPSGAAARKKNALSVAAMTALCEAGAAVSASSSSPKSPSILSSSSSSSSAPAVPKAAKTRTKTDRNAGSDSTRKRRKRDVAVEDAVHESDRQESADESSEEANTIKMSNGARSGAGAADISNADMLLQLNHIHSTARLLPPHTEVVCEATPLLSTTTLLDYYFELVQRYPDRVDVAAPVVFAHSELCEGMMEHRLQDRCTASVVVYDHSFLLHRSDRLRYLPAMRADMMTGGVRDHLHVGRGPAKIWVVFPSFHVEDRGCDNADAAVAILDRHYGARSAWMDARDDPIIAPPLSMFLDAGVHAMLVIQHEGEMVLLPSRSRPCVHLVHTLSPDGVWSAFGVYQSVRHVVDQLAERICTSDIAEQDVAGSFEEYECDPLGEVFVEHAPLHVRASRPTLEYLQRAHPSRAAILRSATSAADLESSEQLIFLLNMTLRDLVKRRVSPHPELLNELMELHRSARTSHQRAGLRVALTQLMALYTKTVNARPYEECSPRYGCGADPFTLSEVERQSDAVVFRLSSRRCARPMLCLHISDTGSATLSTYEALTRIGEECTSTSLTSAGGVVRPTEGASAFFVSAEEMSDGTSMPSSRVSRVQTLLKFVLYNDLMDGAMMKWWRFPLPSDVRRVQFTDLRSLPAQCHVRTQFHQLGCWDFALPSGSSCAEHKQDATGSAGTTADRTTGDAVQAVYTVLHEMRADHQHAHVSLYGDACKQSWPQHDMEAVIHSIQSHPLRNDDRLVVVAYHNGTAALHASCGLELPIVALDPDAERHELSREIQKRWRLRRSSSNKSYPEVSFLNEDLMNQLPLLFSASHLLIDHGSLPPSAARLLEDVLIRMVDSKLRWVHLIRRLSSTPERERESAEHQRTWSWSYMAPAHTLHLENIQAQVYNVSGSHHQSTSLVHVFQRPSGDLGLRAAQHLRAHQAVLPVVGELITNTTFEQLSSQFGSTRGTPLLQWKGQWMRVENVAQFAQGHEDKTRVNLEYTTGDDGQLRYSTLADVEQGNELFVCCRHGDDPHGLIQQSLDLTTLHCLDESIGKYLQ